MNAIEQAPLGTAIYRPGTLDIMVKGLTYVPYPWVDLMSGTPFSNQEVEELGYVIVTDTPRKRVLLTLAQNNGEDIPSDDGIDWNRLDLEYGDLTDKIMELIDKHGSR